MILDIDFKTFCDRYYEQALEIAEKTIAAKLQGTAGRFFDTDLVRDISVSYALEKVYYHYDVDFERGPSLVGFLKRAVSNAVCSELEKEGRNAGKKRSYDSLLNEDGDIKDLFDDSDVRRRSETREDLIREMLRCMKKLQPVDQVILSCWMSCPKSEYTDRALEELGMEDNARNRNVISVRCNRAVESLRKMMSPFRDDFISASPSQQKRDRSSGPRTLVGKLRKAFTDRSTSGFRNRAPARSMTELIDYAGLEEHLFDILVN